MSGATQAVALLQALGVTPVAVTADSRAVRAGTLFLALPGHSVDGRRFITDAVARGACAVLWDSANDFAPPDLAVPNAGVTNLRALAGFLAHRIYGTPSAHLALIGVTGTNGKTTVTQWIAQALAHAGERCGVIGTLGNGYPGALVAASNTTPDACVLYECLAGFVADGASAAAMEVSSIGLEQGRVNGACFAATVWTNLSRDHLDYHGSMESYAAAKFTLFDLAPAAVAIINIDDAHGHVLAERLAARGQRLIACSLERTEAPWPLLAVRDLRLMPAGIACTVTWQGEEVAMEAAVLGAYNVSNLLAVIGVLLARGLSLAEAMTHVARLQPPSGRMQLTGGVDEPLVVVDYAHTPDALAKLLDAVRPAAAARGGRLWCVFGCGGDRDRGKRPVMGELAVRHADEVVITSDNPRNEDPHSIIAAIRTGAGTATNVRCEALRAAAIATAINEAAPADVIVIAGKGHEDYQEIAGVRHPFDDRQVATEALGRRRALYEEPAR